MRNTFIFLLFFGFLGQILNAQYLKLNSNPENPSRQPNWETEIGIILSEDSPIIKVGSGNGEKSSGKLPAGVIVFAKKETGEASWVGICANTIYTSGWKPKGKVISQKNYQSACEEMKVVLLKLEKLQEGMDELLRRPNSNFSLIELQAIFQEELKKNKLYFETPQSPPWKAKKIILPLSFGTAGFFIGGYGFPKETEIVTQTIIPGTKVETSNSGTYLFGPQKIKTEIHTEKSFNWTGAAIGAGSGLILGYLLNEVVF